MKAIKLKKFIDKKNKDFPVVMRNIKHAKNILINNNSQFESFLRATTNTQMKNIVVVELGEVLKINPRSRFERIMIKIDLKLEIWKNKIERIIRIIKE